MPGLVAVAKKLSEGGAARRPQPLPDGAKEFEVWHPPEDDLLEAVPLPKPTEAHDKAKHIGSLEV